MSGDHNMFQKATCHLSQKIDQSNETWFDRLGFARAIEAKLREKNHD